MLCMHARPCAGICVPLCASMSLYAPLCLSRSLYVSMILHPAVHARVVWERGRGEGERDTEERERGRRGERKREREGGEGGGRERISLALARSLSGARSVFLSPSRQPSQRNPVISPLCRVNAPSARVTEGVPINNPLSLCHPQDPGPLLPDSQRAFWQIFQTCQKSRVLRAPVCLLLA